MKIAALEIYPFEYKRNYPKPVIGEGAMPVSQECPGSCSSGTAMPAGHQRDKKERDEQDKPLSSAASV